MAFTFITFNRIESNHVKLQTLSLIITMFGVIYWPL